MAKQTKKSKATSSLTPRYTPIEWKTEGKQTITVPLGQFLRWRNNGQFITSVKQAKQYAIHAAEKYTEYYKANSTSNSMNVELKRTLNLLMKVSRFMGNGFDASLDPETLDKLAKAPNLRARRNIVSQLTQQKVISKDSRKKKLSPEKKKPILL